MSLLTIFLLLILLILLFDHYSQTKKNMFTANDFRTQQYKNNDIQLETTKHAMDQNNKNDQIDIENIKNNIVLNERICAGAKT